MINLLIAGGVAMILALVGTPVLIGWLHANGIGQQIRDDGPAGHFTKAGTPTMGGLMIVGAALGGYLAGHLRGGTIFTRAGILVALATVGAAAVGLTDDWIKVRHQRSLGLNKRAKVAGQLLVAGAFGVLAVNWAHVNTALSFTRWDSTEIVLSKALYVVWAILLIVATSNAVNLTDGLDGLVAGSATFAFSAFALFGFWQFRHFGVYHVPQALDLAVLAVALTGACTGFLWWNCAPARIFMGDTGSLAIGAAMAGLALVMNVHLLLPVVGGLYVLVALSVIVQVASFRLFHRRILRMAPVHHHFELAGWPETTVIVRFWILSGLCTALAIGLFYADFISLRVLD
ncbi:MAG TPA: phospho-N-acetylmuramoyl-pentapeptide-transferase [Acidimicrobiales bacterium]|nr:phospho-N-acetylmuramoyl-pentapeptide-transferase [Acidimicrobiales bacterium]